MNDEYDVYNHFLRSNSQLDCVLNMIVSIIWRKQEEMEIIFGPYRVTRDCKAGSLEAVVNKLTKYRHSPTDTISDLRSS